MKKISTLLLSSLFSIAALAMYDDPHLSISSFTTGKDLQVEVDGRRYSFDKDNSITIRNLSAGSHTIKITKPKKRGNNNRIFDNWNNNKREVVYNSRINLRRGYDFDITINKFGKVFTDEGRIENDNGWNNDRDRDRDRDRDFDRDNDRERDRDPVYDRDYDRNNDRDRKDDYNRGREMSNADFNRAKETLRREMFENTRVDLAKQVINGNLFTAQQVKEMLQLFTFENNKLDLAKYAYRYTLNRNNYYIINDVFTFSNSRDEMARFIREYRE